MPDMKEVLGDLVQDGYITLHVKSMERVVDEGGDWHWEEVAGVLSFSYNEIEFMRHDESGFFIKMCREENGQADMLFWPSTSIIKYINHSNSSEIADKVQAAWDKYNEAQYVEQGLKILEGEINGEELNHHPHGPGCDCPPEGGLPPVPFFMQTTEEEGGNPCGDTHLTSVMSINHVWTCLTCSRQWNLDGELI
jgi:hypothetical protein